jgi:membrane-associated protease RseP (regulator of RpoE activity)
MKFLYYDILFLIIFSIIVALFLYKNRKKLEIEGKILLLYRTKIGIKIIEKISKKFPFLIGILSYVSIFCGYILMILSICLIGFTLYLIITAIALPKIPPIFPLVPYITDIFKLDFLPPFYFTYWIITIAIVAVCHEFMHGIFARFGKIRIKSTGFGFLGPFLAAFVEADEKQMEKKSVKTRLSILSGGSFANLLLAILFIAVINLFFISLYTPSGMIFNTYAVSVVNVSNISALNSIGISNANLDRISIAYSQLEANKTADVKIAANEKIYFTNYELLGIQLKSKQDAIIAYDDTPAYANKIIGAIKEISYQDTKFRILNQSDLTDALNKLKPGDMITLTTTAANYNLTLGKSPLNESKAYIGVGIIQPKSKLAWLTDFILIKNDFSTYYEPISHGEMARLVIFVYNLLFWIVIINISIMIVNMLPFGIFDGGRFFYLTVLGITSSRKAAEKCFKIMHSFILLLLIAMMVIWTFRII